MSKEVSPAQRFAKAGTTRVIQGNKVLLETVAGMQGWYFFIYWLQ